MKANILLKKDHSGFISPDEVKAILGHGKIISEKVWASIISQVDANGDGQISFEEFQDMMTKFSL